MDRRTVSLKQAGVERRLFKAHVLVWKYQLAWHINSIVAERGLTQREAAKILNLHQPEVSLLRRKRLDSFSLQRLVNCLDGLGACVEAIVHRMPLRTTGPGRQQKTPLL